MIEEARRLPASMLAIGVTMLVGFVVIAVAAVLSVGGSQSESPELSDLALPVGVEVVDTHATCDPSVCDGVGLVVDRDGVEVPEMAQMIADHLRTEGWTENLSCDYGAVCLKHGDLRVEIRPWLDLDEMVAPTMRASLEENGVDQSRLVYVGYYRCGVLRVCA